MNTEAVRDAAREKMTLCKACPVCDGRGCRGKMPGPGGWNGSENFLRSYDKLKEVRLNMDTLHEEMEPDTSFSAFGRTFRYPVFAAPIGMVGQNFGPFYDDLSYTQVLVEGCAAAGICAMTGDSPIDATFEGPLSVIKERGGAGLPTVKSWPDDKLAARIKSVEDAGAFAIAMDVDCVGLLAGKTPFCTRSGEQIKQVIKKSKLPFILKGIMTVRAAQQAVDAGAAGIVVSTHGGRVMADAAAPAEVLASIADKVKGKLTIFADGGIRTGADIVKALALGADAVLIGRPFVVAAYGGGAQGIEAYVEALGQSLKKAMVLCGAPSLKEIGPEHIVREGSAF